MNFEIAIVYAVLLGAAILFITNRIRNDLVAILVMLSLMVSGVLTVPESLAGFSDPVVLIIVAMFIVSEALVNTGIARRIGELVISSGQGSEARLIVMLMLAVGVVGAFMSSTAAVAIFIPVTLSVARTVGLNKKRLLMPLAIASLVSGMMTLVATAPNLIVNQVLASKGFKPFGFFSFSPFGIAILGVSMVFLLLAGMNLLSRDKRAREKHRRRLMRDIFSAYGLTDKAYRLRVPPTSPLVDRALARIRSRVDFDIHVVAFEKRHQGKVTIKQSAPEIVFESGHEILVIGGRENIERLAATYGLQKLSLRGHTPYHLFTQTVGIAEIMLSPESGLIGKTLVESQFRNRYEVHVLGIRRHGKPVTDQVADIPLDFGDVLLVNATWPQILRLRDEVDHFVLLNLPEESTEIIPAAPLAPRAMVILAAMVAAMASGLVPTVTAAMVAALLLIVCRCVSMGSIYRIINWEAVVLIAGIMPLATALTKSGAAHLISLGLVDMLGRLGPYGMLAVIYMIAAATGLFISNTATAVLIAPIAIDAAITVNASPHAFAMTVALACSAAFVTPVSSPVNMMVLEPGGYVFTDFAKVGIPLLFLSMIATVALVGAIYL